MYLNLKSLGIRREPHVGKTVNFYIYPMYHIRGDDQVVRPIEKRRYNLDRAPGIGSDYSFIQMRLG